MRGQGLYDVNEVVNQLKSDEKLLDWGEMSDGQSSDSCPSEDNLDANVLAKIVPKNNHLT